MHTLFHMGQIEAAARTAREEDAANPHVGDLVFGSVGRDDTSASGVVGMFGATTGSRFSGAAGGRGAADDDEDDPNHVTATPKSPLLAPVRRGSTAGAPGPELPFAQRSSSTGSAPRRQSLAGDSASPSVSGGAGVGVGPAVSASAGAGAGSTSE